MDSNVEEALKKWAENNKLKKEKEKEISELEDSMSSLAQQVLENSDSNTIHYNGKWYNIRKRKRTGKHYICEMDRKPGSWFKKENKNVE